MAQQQRAHINHAILVWARNQCRLELPVAAKRIGVKTEKLESWESGATEPTVNQMRKAAHVYRFALAIFYLQEAPSLYQPIRDYRRFFGIEEDSMSPELAMEVRQAHDRRDVVIELSQALEEEFPAFSMRAFLTDDPERLATRIRGHLGVTIEMQSRWRDASVALREWRAAIERAGVLVFQAKGIDLGEMRGFSIGDGTVPVIVVNRADAYAARVFTLLHELTHVSLHRAGLCNLLEHGAQAVDIRQLEAFCNHVSGAVLVPKTDLLENIAVSAHRGMQWSPAELDPIAKRFCVSRQVLIRRLLMLGRTNQAVYDDVMTQLAEEFRSLPPRGKGFLAPSADLISLAGRVYSRLAISAYRDNQITASTLSDLLGLRLKHVGAVEASVTS